MDFLCGIIGASDASVTNATAKSIESSAAQRSARTVPKAPTSHPPSVSSDPAAPTTPSKGMLDLIIVTLFVE